MAQLSEIYSNFTYANIRRAILEKPKYCYIAGGVSFLTALISAVCYYLWYQKLSNPDWGSWGIVFIPYWCIGGMLLLISLLYVIISVDKQEGAVCIFFIVLLLVAGILSIAYVPLIYFTIYLDGGDTNPNNFLWFFWTAAIFSGLSFLFSCKRMKTGEDKEENGMQFLKRKISEALVCICYLIALDGNGLRDRMDGDDDTHYSKMLLPVFIMYGIQILFEQLSIMYTSVIESIMYTSVIESHGCLSWFSQSIGHIIYGCSWRVFVFLVILFADGYNIEAWEVCIPHIVCTIGLIVITLILLMAGCGSTCMNIVSDLNDIRDQTKNSPKVTNAMSGDIIGKIAMQVGEPVADVSANV